MKKYSIYEHISPSGKVYVGQTSNLNIRWQGNGNRYLNKNKKGLFVQPYFAHALLKYGWDNFEHRIILENIPKSEANYAEKYLIKWYKLHNMSYNCTDGGEGACGIKRTMSLEMRKHMSEIMRAFHPLKGTHRTEKQKQAAREKMLGRKASKEARFNMRMAHLGKSNPHRCKEVYAFDKQSKYFVRKFSSISEASKYTGISHSAICNTARGKCPSAGSYIWSFSPNIDKNDLRFKMMENLKVYCYSLDGVYLRSFNNTKEAAESVKGIINCINDCCSKRILSYKGYIWRKQFEDISEEVLTRLKYKRKRKCA